MGLPEARLGPAEGRDRSVVEGPRETPPMNPVAGGTTIVDLLKRDMERPHNRYLNSPLVRLITSGQLPRAAIKDYAVLRWPFQAHADLAMMISHAAFLRGEDAGHLLE